MPLYKSTGRVLEAKRYPPLATYANLVTGGNFPSTDGWTTIGGTGAVASNIYSQTANGTSQYPAVYQNLGIKPTCTGYLRIKFRVTNSVCSAISMFFRDSEGGVAFGITIQSNPTINTWYTLSVAVPISGLVNNLYVYIRHSYADAATANGKVMEVDGTYGVLAVNLTERFGSGNEPSAAWCDTNLPFVVSSGTALRPIDKMLDRSRFVNHGTFSGTTWVQLPSGIWVMNFDGADDYVEMADSPELRMKLGGTFETWIYPITIGEGDAGRVFDKSTSTLAQNGYQVQIYTLNRIAAIINNGTALISSNNAITFSKWQHAVMTFDATGRHLYVNGIDVTASGGTETALPPNVAGVVAIGNRAGATDRSFYGYIAPPSIYDYARTQAQILARYTAERWWYGV